MFLVTTSQTSVFQLLAYFRKTRQWLFSVQFYAESALLNEFVQL